MSAQPVAFGRCVCCGKKWKYVLATVTPDGPVCPSCCGPVVIEKVTSIRGSPIKESPCRPSVKRNDV